MRVSTPAVSWEEMRRLAAGEQDWVLRRAGAAPVMEDEDEEDFGDDELEDDDDDTEVLAVFPNPEFAEIFREKGGFEEFQVEALDLYEFMEWLDAGRDDNAGTQRVAEPAGDESTEHESIRGLQPDECRRSQHDVCGECMGAAHRSSE